METLVLSDRTIAHVARILQMAILTGTDIVDNLRMMRVVNNEGTLELDPEYASNFDGNIETLLNDANVEAGDDTLARGNEEGE